MFCGTACCVFEKNAKYPKFHDSTNFKAVFWRFYGQNAYFISVVLHLLVINKRPFYLKNEANLCFLGKIGESIYFDIFVVSGRFLIKVKILGPTISRMSRWSWGSMLLTPMRSPIFKWIISPRDPMTIDPITIPGRPTHPSLSPAISGRWVWRSCATKIGFSQLHIRSRVKKGPTQPFPIRRVVTLWALFYPIYVQLGLILNFPAEHEAEKSSKKSSVHLINFPKVRLFADTRCSCMALVPCKPFEPASTLCWWLKNYQPQNPQKIWSQISCSNIFQASISLGIKKLDQTFEQV